MLARALCGGSKPAPFARSLTRGCARVAARAGGFWTPSSAGSKQGQPAARPQPQAQSQRRAGSAAASSMAAPAAATQQLEIVRVPCLSDNYAWLLHEPGQGLTAVVDTPEAGPIQRALEERGWKLTHILNTHHHWDHTGGNEELKSKYGCTVVGPAADAARMPGIDIALKDGEEYALGSAKARCFDTPGHTRGHITYWFPDSQALFPGDTLFSLGCGRLFEGTPQQMWASLSKLLSLPPETRVYCAHEYTAGNARFAASVDGGNPALQRRVQQVEQLRAQNLPTIPSLLGEELEANPFLRPNDPAIRASLGVPPSASSAEAFAAIRAAKDSFK